MIKIEKASVKKMAADIIAEIQKSEDNRAKCENCSGHDFEMTDFGKYRCENCGCEVDLSYVSGYQDALKHIRTKKMTNGKGDKSDDQ